MLKPKILPQILLLLVFTFLFLFLGFHVLFLLVYLGMIDFFMTCTCMHSEESHLAYDGLVAFMQTHSAFYTMQAWNARMHCKQHARLKVECLHTYTFMIVHLDTSVQFMNNRIPGSLVLEMRAVDTQEVFERTSKIHR